VTSRVRLADVAPTVLQAAGLAVPPAMQGESLLPLAGQPAQPPQPRQSAQPPQPPPEVRLQPDATSDRKSTAASGRDSVVASGFSQTLDRPVYAETDYPRQAFGWSDLVSWRADGHLFVRAPRRELYDERAGAGTAKNLSDTQRPMVERLERDLDQFIRRSAGGGSSASSDPALAQRLASLGYVGGSGGSARSTVDPKDRIQTANALHTAIVAVEDGAFATAIPLLESVTAAEPTIPIAQLNLGVARARTRQFAPAIAALEKAVLLDPQSAFARYELASAYYETGDLKTAATHFGVVAARMPKWADARYSLASVYARIDRVGDAIAELKTSLAIEPRHFRANLLIGRILTLQGQAAEALPYLRTAAEVQPSTAEAHQFLADAYEKTGNAAEAARARRRAQELTRK